MEESSFILTLVRHGETDHNLRAAVTHDSNVSLNGTGVKQGNLVGLRLKNEKFTRVYSSHLLRTQETAQLILANSVHNHSNTKLVIDERIRERELEGVQEGDPPGVWIHNGIRWMQNENKPLFRYNPVGAETYQDLKIRITSFFTEFCERHSAGEVRDENILIVSHGLWIMSLVDELMTSDLYTIDGKSNLEHLNPTIRNPFLPNTSVAKLRISRELGLDGRRRVEIITYKDHSHLDSLDLKQQS